MTTKRYAHLDCEKGTDYNSAVLTEKDNDISRSTLVTEEGDGNTKYSFSLSRRDENRHPMQLMKVEGTMELLSPPRNEIEQGVLDVKESCNKLGQTKFKLPSP